LGVLKKEKYQLKFKNNIFDRLLTLLNQPFPKEIDTFGVLRQCAFVGLFIFLF